MLINKSVSAGDIVSMKLITGEEVVAKLVETNSSFNTFTISKPVVMTMVQPGQFGFMPLMVTSDESATITLTTNSLICLPVKSKPDVANNYRKATTGIEVPTQENSSGLVLP